MYGRDNRPLLQTLVELATNKCIQNISRLQDVGQTPFHLLSPILERMNAKQLSQIEETSPQILPHTDTIWPKLIEKDFPDRPIYAKEGSKNRRPLTTNSKVSPMEESMPNKALYYRYVKDRESFRQDSAKRLRNITERLKQEKEAKAIVAVPQLLRDPTVRRRQQSSSYLSSPPAYGYSLVKKNTIIGKAKRDLKNRPLMFPQAKTKSYDPYAVFSERRQPSPPSISAPPTNRRTRPPTSFNTMETRNQHTIRSSSSLSSDTGAVIVSPPMIQLTSPRPASAMAQPLVHLNSLTSVPGPETPGSPIPPPRKRKPEASIFLSRKRHVPPRQPTSSKPRNQQTLPSNSSPSKSSSRKLASGPSKIQSIRSSIFN